MTDGWGRRRFLAALGTAFAGSIAGCSGRIPGTEPPRIDAASAAEPGRLLWTYPPEEDDREQIGYASVVAERSTRHGSGDSPALDVELNSTVGMAGGNSDDGYRPDWFRFRVRPPTDYEGHAGFTMRVEPPGQFEGFSAYYDRQGVNRWCTVELREVDTRGTIITPVVFDSPVDTLPDRLHCEFTARISQSGPLGKTARIAESAVLDIPE